jgi:SAM-dependent methyltransferase
VSTPRELAPPASFFSDELDALVQSARLGPVVDLACGRGRHSAASAGAQLCTIGLDRNGQFLNDLRAHAARAGTPLSLVRFDLEAGLGPPFREGSCGAILIFRFLYRPMAPLLPSLLAPGGLLLYETFTVGQLELGSGPRNRDFLLEPGELRELFPTLEVLRYDEGLHDGAMTAQLVARRPA